MMIVGWIVCGLLLIAYFSFVIWGLICGMDVLTQVNARLPREKQFPLIGNHRTWELWRQYKILYPDGRLHRQSVQFSIVGFLCLLAAFFTFHWFHLSIHR